ncbi:Phosphoglycerate kinase [Candidatus Cyrtobacter comes]|uniref:Phosphoglycerate kinase n=1 Tax=Candidatus Cyrtobacter comes TaxID=675776 RepID=A0ABU5L764_9RICK|nr:phosphoglycerate kinase [Candidatus Cyrtobacter comes]MDZ5761887.1 Phosphoglycerate kinase [Candidatus Cyrtobacter comes]
MIKCITQKVFAPNSNAIIRVDFNVPLGIDYKILDYSRLESAKNSINLLLKNCKRVLLLSHFGRPKGKYTKELSLANIVSQISKYYGVEIIFINSLNELNDKEGLVLLENTRFFPEEEKNDQYFARTLAQHAELYVNEAFSCSHRAHASLHAITNYLESYAGTYCFNEITALERISLEKNKDIIAIIGGSKISSKIGVLRNLFKKVRLVAIGGAMANTFLKAKGIEIGSSLYEPESLDIASEILSSYKILLPIDVVCKNNNSITIKDIHSVEDGDCIMDIGPRSCIEICSAIKNTQSVIWNGPMGKFEEPEFIDGTRLIAKFISSLNDSIYSVVGGGDTLAALSLLNIKLAFSHVSTAGGAFLEWMEKGSLPCIDMLKISKTTKT